MLKDELALRRMGAALQRYVVAGFTWKNAAENYLRLSREILDAD
jgi:glycosyltransferase involved in cell wall biosynthesis